MLRDIFWRLSIHHRISSRTKILCCTLLFTAKMYRSIYGQYILSRIYGWFILTELLCIVEMMLPPKNHEISNPAPGVFPKLSWVVWTHFWWFRVHIWAQNWAETRKIRKYLKIRPNKMWWLKCLLIIKNAWDFGYLHDFPREFEWRIENWHFWKKFLVKLAQLFWAL